MVGTWNWGRWAARRTLRYMRYRRQILIVYFFPQPDLRRFFWSATSNFKSEVLAKIRDSIRHNNFSALHTAHYVRFFSLFNITSSTIANFNDDFPRKLKVGHGSADTVEQVQLYFRDWRLKATFPVRTVFLRKKSGDDYCHNVATSTNAIAALPGCGSVASPQWDRLFIS